MDTIITQISGRDDLPPIIDVVTLAEALGCCSPQQIGYYVQLQKSPMLNEIRKQLKRTGKLPPIAHSFKKNMLGYDYFTLPKKSGGFRLISAPKPWTSKVQYAIKSQILDKLPVHPEVAIGYIPKESRPEGWTWQKAIHGVLGNAELFAKADIHNFFGSISHRLIKDKLMKYTKYNGLVAAILTYLMTDMGFAPQGAITSAGISNFIMLEADEELKNRIAERGWSVVRYADDYVFGKKEFDPFSDETSMEEEGKWLFDTLEDVLKGIGLTLNRKKCDIFPKWQQKPIMGLVDYVKLNIPRRYYDRLKAAVHNFTVKGQVPEAYVGKEMTYLRALKGKVAYWNHINPQKLGKLRKELVDLNGEFIKARNFSGIKTPKNFWSEVVNPY